MCDCGDLTLRADILEGKGKMFINDECATLEPGDTVYIPPNAKQCIENISDQELVFICIVDPAWKEEDEVVY